MQSVTIHNTNDLLNVVDDAEQYTRATYNQNMLSARVHFFVDENGAWQNLRAGTGMCVNDPVGEAEVSWHAGDGSSAGGGNQTSLSIEIIMSDAPTLEENIIAKDKGARLAAWLLWKNNLGIENLVTHTYWVNKSVGNTFENVDRQCVNPVYGQKWCPLYIMGDADDTYNNWMAFKRQVEGYLDLLRQYPVVVTSECIGIYSGPGAEYSVTGVVCECDVCYIVEEYTTGNCERWGRLKDGRGWIPLSYVEIPCM